MKKILIIEDHPDVRENTAEILELSGFEVRTAENGKIGIKKANEERPDLILCDIMMPELDGYGVLRILGKSPKTNTIPFIFLTAKAEKEDFRKGMQLGADDYLTKPFGDVELLDAVELRLRKSELLYRSSENADNDLQSFIDEARGLKEMTDLSQNREERLYRKKDIIFSEGQTPHYVFQIKTGKVKIYRSNEEGREFIVALIGPGEYFGYLAVLQNRNYPERAVAMEDTELTLIPKQDFYTLIHNNRDVAGRFIKMLAGNVFAVEEQLIDLAYNSVRKRVADALIRLKERYDSKGQEKFTISILRDDLAQLVGTAKETVIRMLSDFKEEGLVEMKGSKITILDEDRLRKMWQ